MSFFVTGAAGFIGSHLAQRLVDKGEHVVGVDSFTDYYPRDLKASNLKAINGKANFELYDRDINTADLGLLLKSTSCVFHLAAQPGVRPSWGASFGRYINENVLATQKLLEACKGSGIKRFVYSSSSSVYGDAERFPTAEDVAPSPISPYGVTKLAAEHLCRLYQRNFGVPVVMLRYFTVYGPRQRPDMAFNRFIKSIANGTPLEVLGDGTQSRDFTFVDDVVNATLLAVEATIGSTYNVGSGRTVQLAEAIRIIEHTVGKTAKLRHNPAPAGDVTKTSADISKIQSELGYLPRVWLEEGLAKQVAWQLATGL